MNENTKLVYSTLQDIFKNVWEQQKYSEVKNGVLLTFNVAIFAIIVRMYFYISTTINSSLIYKSLLFILLVVFSIHIILIIQSFFPKDKNKENIRYSNDDINIFFFGDIQKMQSKEYLKIVIEKHDIEDNDINKSLLLNLSNQIVKLSEITQYKYASFKNSIYRMYFLLFSLFIYFTYIFFMN